MQVWTKYNTDTDTVTVSTHDQSVAGYPYPQKPIDDYRTDDADAHWDCVRKFLQEHTLGMTRDEWIIAETTYDGYLFVPLGTGRTFKV